MNYLYIFATILLTVYGQIIIKWQVSKVAPFPTDSTEKTWFFLKLLINPWVISSLLAAFLAFLSWTVAMSKFDLSHAYPFMSLAFVLVMVLSSILFYEEITLLKLIGMGLVVLGIVVGSQG